MGARRSRPPFANAWFFPAAALYAAVLLPLSVLSMLGLMPALPGLVSPAGHAHEMLYGFALAVVAGYLLGPQPRETTLILLGCWLLARIGFLLWPYSWLATAAAALFAAGLAWKVVPRFLGAAKKWRNRVVAPVVAALAAVSVVATLELARPLSWLYREALVLFSILLFFMGGRIIAPAVAGHAKHAGWQLQARVQPWLEGAVLILLLTAVLVVDWPLAGARAAAGLALVVAGLLTALRLLRWQPWRCAGRGDLLMLALGYGWLAVGMVLLGGSWWHLGLPQTVALHALTVGALGSLTFTVMARTVQIQVRRDPCARRWIYRLGPLLSVAALVRLTTPPGSLGQPLWWWLAALCWAVAFGGLTLLLWQFRPGTK